MTSEEEDAEIQRLVEEFEKMQTQDLLRDLRRGVWRARAIVRVLENRGVDTGVLEVFEAHLDLGGEAIRPLIED